jgi:hypothetical protein
MPDRSMRVALLRLFCDAPGHKPTDPTHADFEADFETLAEGRVDAKYHGWLFKSNGRTICPKCAGGDK